MTMNPPSSTTTPAASVDPMDWLFGEIYGLFGNQFLDKFRSGHVVDGKDTGIENMKTIWADKIRSNAMRLPEIKRGIKGCERLKFGAPGWPEFFELCRPTPNVDDAITEAIAQLSARREGKDEWSHPAIYWAATKIGYFEMTNTGHAVLRPRFAAALAKVLEQPRIDPVPVMRVALPQPGQTELNIDEAKVKLLTLRVSGVLKSADSAVDHFRWAKRILEQEALGQNVSMYQLESARQAMRTAY